MEFSRHYYWSGLSFPTPGDLPDTGIKPMSPALAGGFFTTAPPGKPIYHNTLKKLFYFWFCGSYRDLCPFLLKVKSESEITQLCPTLWDPMDCSLWGSSIHGIFQARVLEWVAISFSRRSSPPRDRSRVFHILSRCFYSLSHQGNLHLIVFFFPWLLLVSSLCLRCPVEIFKSALVWISLYLFSLRFVMLPKGFLTSMP